MVGDAAPQETADVVAHFDDPRLRYENLAIQGPYPEDNQGRWFVAGTAPMNRAVHLANGSWVAFLNDDDALRPEHVSTLLEHARERRSEVAYSKMLVHFPDESPRRSSGSSRRTRVLSGGR